MKKLMKRIGCFIWAIILMFCLCFGFVGCGKDKKYDVSIKIVSNWGGRWIFTPDIDEMSIEIPYSGEEYKFWVDSWNLSDHPRWKNEWFKPATSGTNGFHKSMLYTAPGEMRHVWKGPIKERGEYIILWEADSSSDLWEYRTARLYVTII